MKLPRFARARARRLVESPGSCCTSSSKRGASRHPPEARAASRPVLAELRTILELLRAWAQDEYSGVSNANLLLIVGAVVYFLMPVDLVPDFILGLGFADDAAVIAWVVGAVRDELAKSKAWQPGDEEPREESMPDLLALNVAWGARAASMATSSSGARAGLYLVLGAWPAAAAGPSPVSVR